MLWSFRTKLAATQAAVPCRCTNQQPDFCPYCDLSQSDSVPELAPSPARPRKLRKSRPDYYHPLVPEDPALPVTDDNPDLRAQSVLSLRPESLLSTHSTTPLLNSSARPNPAYAPLPQRRTPNKLEKSQRSRRHSSIAVSPYAVLASGVDKVAPKPSFKAFSRAKSMQSLAHEHKRKSHSVVIATNDLVSLAWTGSPASESSPSLSPSLDAAIPPLESFPWPPVPSSSQIIPSVPKKLCKDQDLRTLPPSPSWSLANALTDDRLSDERLVGQLEDMRVKHTDATSPRFSVPPGSVLYDSLTEYPLQPGEQEDLTSPSETDSSWNTARQVLLICREIIRTERRYLSSLKILMKSGTTTPTPPTMLVFIPGLISVSDTLLKQMTDNPSVQGVSEAFLAVQDQFREAFVSWSSIVGNFFHSEDAIKDKLDTREAVASPSSSKNARSRPTSLRSGSAESSIASSVLAEPNKIKKNLKTRPTLRDLAILPTQRIVRYVLLLKELHVLTPTTLPSFAVLDRALDLARSVAHAANEAQEHSAFTLPTLIS